MTNQELIKALGRLKVQTGSLACMGCGQEDSCGVRGCAIMQEAVKALEELARANKRMGIDLRKALTDLKQVGSCEVCVYGQTGGCSAPKDQTFGGSCFVWRGLKP